MNRFLYQSTHFLVPGPVSFIIYAVLQIAKDMRKTLLVLCSIVIKGFLVIVN